MERLRGGDLWRVDRYGFLLAMDQCTSRDIERGMVAVLMRWWASKDTLYGPQVLHQRCWYCGKPHQNGRGKLCYDHAFPQYYVSTPLVPCCLRCNSQKRALTPQEYRRFHPEGQFWFEHIGLADSPLGYAIREDLQGFRHVLTCYLIDRSQQSGAGIRTYA
jgi:hypothetical protein